MALRKLVSKSVFKKLSSAGKKAVVKAAKATSRVKSTKRSKKRKSKGLFGF